MRGRSGGYSNRRCLNTYRRQAPEGSGYGGPTFQESKPFCAWHKEERTAAHAPGRAGKRAFTWRASNAKPVSTSRLTGAAPEPPTTAAAAARLQQGTHSLPDYTHRGPSAAAVVKQQRRAEQSLDVSTAGVGVPSLKARQERSSATVAPKQTPLVAPGHRNVHLILPEYAKNRPNQLLRLSPRGVQPTGSALPQQQQPPSSSSSSAGGTKSIHYRCTTVPLVRSSRHSLVRCSNIVSAAARTVAAVSRPSPVKPAREWLRPRHPGIQKRVLQRNAPHLAASTQRPRKTAASQKYKWQREGPVQAAKSLKGWPKAWLPRTPLKSQFRCSNASPASKKARAKLVRINGVIYKVAGSGAGRSLQRQLTPKTVVRKPLAAQVQHYQRQGSSLLRLLSAAVSPRSTSKQQAMHRLKTGIPAKRVSSERAARIQRTNNGTKLGVIAQIRKSNTFVNRVCVIYCRTGKCADKDKGTCSLVHDPAKVAVCPQWLAGNCSRTGCTLQHEAKQDLMPLCMHFLRGSCSNVNCPYLHVMLDPKAPACKDFLQGYCPKGAACPQKHLTAGMRRTLRGIRVTTNSQGAGVQGLPVRKRTSIAASNEQPGAKRAAPSAERCTPSIRNSAGVAEDACSEQDLMRPAFLRGLC